MVLHNMWSHLKSKTKPKKNPNKKTHSQTKSFETTETVILDLAVLITCCFIDDFVVS